MVAPNMFSQPNNPNCPVKMLKTYSHARRYKKKSADIKILVAPPNKPHVVSMVFTLANRKEHYWKNDEKYCFSWRARRKKN